jgi:hypothetical protein
MGQLGKYHCQEGCVARQTCYVFAELHKDQAANRSAADQCLLRTPACRAIKQAADQAEDGGRAHEPVHPAVAHPLDALPTSTRQHDPELAAALM